MKKKELKRQLSAWEDDAARQHNLVLTVSLQRDTAWREINRLHQVMQEKIDRLHQLMQGKE